MSEPATGAAPAIHPAATVLLLRESAAGLQVLLTQRAAGLAFMGGLWVFPGGRMEPEDASPALIARLAPQTTQRLALDRLLDREGQSLDPTYALGLHVAACRETYEEAGLLLAHPAQSAQCSAEQLARVVQRRAAATDAQGFLRLLEEEDLLLDADQLVYWAHWITPSQEKRRFDTRFFAIRVPEGQEASADLGELTQHAWVTERDVADRLAAGTMKLAPPTIATLHDLWHSHARHGGLEAMLTAERERNVPPILPKLVVGTDAFEAVLPWDPEYGSLPGESCAVPGAVPVYLRDLPSRRSFRRG